VWERSDTVYEPRMRRGALRSLYTVSLIPV
jgi:hypothetical protein